MNTRASPGFELISASFITHAVKGVCVEGSRKPQHVNVHTCSVGSLRLWLRRLVSLLTGSRPSSAHCIRKVRFWTQGVTALLVVNGTLYRLYVNVLRDLVTSWYEAKKNIPDTQFGFYPCHNTLQPILVLRQLCKLSAPAIYPGYMPLLLILHQGRFQTPSAWC